LARRKTLTIDALGASRMLNVGIGVESFGSAGLAAFIAKRRQAT